MSSTLGFFWLFLTVAFLAMAIFTYRMKKVVMPDLFKQAHKKEYFQGPDIDKLKPLFDHMLLIETAAFLLTAISAFLEFWIK